MRHFAVATILLTHFAGWLGSCANSALCDERPTNPAIEPIASFEHGLLPFLTQFCMECHSGKNPDAEFLLDKIATAKTDVQKERRAWNKVLERLSSEEMPPEDADVHPTSEDRAAAITWLTEALNRVDCSSHADPGRVTIRRLNRNEYRNTIRDLLGVDFDTHRRFPRDDTGYGFDNIGDVLTLSPLHLEKYLAAAEEIAERAIVAPELITEPREKIEFGSGRGRRRRARLNTNGEVTRSHEFRAAGRYVLRLRAGAEQAGDELARIAFVVDDKQVNEVAVASNMDDPQWFSAVFRVEPGVHEIGGAFVNDFYDADHPDSDRRDRNLLIAAAEVVGPIDTALENLPASHRKLLQNAVDDEMWKDESAWRNPAKKNLHTLLRRAFRRPPHKGETERLLELMDYARREGTTHERAMQLVLQAVLVSPHFLFRGEIDRRRNDAQAIRDVNEWELASRISYFLTSSMPDEELFANAKAGTLRENLAAQVNRILADKRSDELARHFVGQWLETRKLTEVAPDPLLVSRFDDELRRAMAEETEMLFTQIKRKDLNVLTLLNADFTFVNERLASHYGMDEVIGDRMRMVSLPANSPRGGVLTHASVLTVTSDPNRTSPVKRGKWILENILNEPPAPPPPDVPELEETREAAESASLRERMELHRSNTTCASCHEKMDPLGFALENFDAVGRWRDKEGQHDIDASGELPDGRTFNGAAGLREILLSDADRFRRTIAEKLLTYALGRGLEYYDECALRGIVEHMNQNDDRFSALVTAIVNSAPFQQRRGE